jgi:hypothetical protein
MPWSLITSPAEMDRCCVVIDGAWCEQRCVVRISGDGWDDYTYTCADHVELVREDDPDVIVERLR